MSRRIQLSAAALGSSASMATMSNEDIQHLNHDPMVNHLIRLWDLSQYVMAQPPLEDSIPPEQSPAYLQIQQDLQAVNEELQILRLEGQGLETRLATTEQDLTRANATITSLNTALANVPQGAAVGGGSKKTAIPSPAKFDGTTANFRPFATQLQMKLQGDAHRFTDEQHCLTYTIGLLEGRAFLQVQHNVTLEGINYKDVAALLAELEQAFGDPNRVATAERALRTLVQKNRPFVEYLADFQHLAANTNWNDAAKRTSLYHGLSSELKDVLTSISDPPEHMNDYANLLKKLDNNIRARTAERKGSPASWHTPAPAQACQIASTPPTTTTGTASGPMDLSSGRRALTDAQRQERMRRGLCLYCGGHGPMARECPNKKPRRMYGANTLPARPPDIPEDTRPDSEELEN